jgi:hypothetical protein
MRTRANLSHPAIRPSGRFVALIAVAAAVSIVASPLVGGVVLALGLVVLISFEATRPAGVLRAAEHAAHPHGGRHHVVVVADAPLAGDEIAEAIAGVAGPDAELDVLAPVLVSHLHYVTSDHDSESREAESRLAISLAWAAEHGFRARGEVGDDEPATAIADELRDFGADAVVIVTNDMRRTRWAQERELERARAELDVPVMHLQSAS